MSWIRWDVEFLGCFAVDLFQESQPFDMSVMLLGARDQLAFHCIEWLGYIAKASELLRIDNHPSFGPKRYDILSNLRLVCWRSVQNSANHRNGSVGEHESE